MITFRSHTHSVTPIGLIVLSLLITAASSRASGQTVDDLQSSVPSPPTLRVGPPALLTEPRILAQTIEAVSTQNNSKEGFYPELGQMITGSGWISAGPGFRHHFLSDRGVFDISSAVSWRAYKIAQSRIEVTNLAKGHLSVGSQALWQDATQIDYFGTGAASRATDRTEYRLRSTDAVGYAQIRINRWLTVDVRGGRLFQATVSSAVGPFNGGFGDTRTVFGEEGAPGSTESSPFLHGDVSVAVDTRDRPGYPRSGALLRGAWSAYSDRGSGAFSFRRYEAEAVQYLPMFESRWTVALHGWLVASDTTATSAVPFFLLPSLGGQDTLRGYLDYRFHDRDLLVVNAESRFALFAHVDVAAFADAGDVAQRTPDLDLRKTSFGFGLRAHSRTSVIGRLDLAHSAEGWRVLFRMDDVLALARLSRRATPGPFVP